MKNKKLIFYVAVIVIGIITLQACKTYYFRSNYTDVNKLLHETDSMHAKQFLKAHLKSGEVCILKDTWKVDTLLNLITGEGKRFDFNRNPTFSGTISIPIDSIAIIETNRKLNNPEAARIAALSILAGVDILIGILCITDPKACFGSCPTFYINGNDNFHYADAEGFSNAIAPSMEYFDIDALNNKIVAGKTFSITMKNEALETHCVNDVKLLAYPRKKGERIYHGTPNNFYLCRHNYPLTKATANEGEVTALLQKEDRHERFSLADENNLSSKEEVYLSFEDVNDTKDLGLIIDFRQTLMTTYFIYSAIGYMGDEVGDIFARVENNKATRDKLKAGIKKELGNIDVYLWDENNHSWELQDGFNETGPIALNRQILPLKNGMKGPEIKIKVVMNKGLWRIDYLALTNIKEKVKPVEIAPTTILNKGILDNAALTAINSPKEYLISMPGCEYKFNFALPAQGGDYELFLYSKGYYLEWMREHWIKDKNLLKLRQMVENPRRYLRTEAGNYKRYENTMEREFWNSKIDTKTFSYYEN